MRTLGITAQSELRQVNHRAVIDWERHMREVERAASSRLSAGACQPSPACSSIWCATAMPRVIR